jgi:hypothetical protein
MLTSYNSNVLQVDGDDLVRRLDCWRADLSCYLKYVRDKECKSGGRWKRYRKQGIQGHMVTCAPHWSNLIFEAANGLADLAREFAERAARELVGLCQEETHRRVISVQCHFDTTSLHWHLFSTRKGPDHRLILRPPRPVRREKPLGSWLKIILARGIFAK